MSDRQATKDLLERLHRHYIKPGPMPGGIFLPECGWNGTTGSRVDALYVGFTSTSGRTLVGHELKVSRADWRHELDKSGKADPWHDQCHAWYVVAPSTDIVPIEELPTGWGLMVINPRTKTRLDIKVKATVRPDHTPSWNAVRSMMARLDTLQAQVVGDIKRTALDTAREEMRKEFEKRHVDALSGEQRRRLEALDSLEKELGVSLDRWDSQAGGVAPDVLARAIHLARSHRNIATHRDDYMPQQVRQTATRLLERVEEYEAALDSFRGALDVEQVSL